MSISEISIEEKKCWNDIVRSFVDYDVFYLNEYVTAFMQENSSNGIPILLYYTNGKDRAINVVFKRDISQEEKLKGKLEKGIWFDLVSPYGYGGFWGNIVDFQTLNKTYNMYCISNRYICEFVRFELFNNYYKHYDGETESRTHNVVRNLEMSIDEMWMSFKPKVRKNVKRAIKNNLEIAIENTGEYLTDFLEIYYSTMDRSNAEQEYYFSRDFFSTINTMKDNIMYFHVISDGKIISTELVIYGAKTCYSYLGGTLKEYFNLRPNDFLKFEIIKWAYNIGLKNFVLGGGYGADDGVFQYKTCLAPDGIVDFYIGRKIFDEKKYNILLDLRAEENPACRESKFFPQYRA